MRIRQLLLGKPYRTGQGVKLSGGRDLEPKWLQGEVCRKAHIVEEIQGKSAEPALVVEFSMPFNLEGYSAKYGILD